MSLVEASTTFGGNTFWGLVHQRGPWKSTASDQKRAAEGKANYGGGGTAAGGTVHAGHGNWKQIMTPIQLNGSAAPLHPSEYAMRSVMMPLIDMKKQTKIGRTKFHLTLASRAPFQTGHKMGFRHEEIRIDEPGQVREQVPLYMEGNFITEMEHENIPHYTPPSPSIDQSKASEIARDDERKQVYQEKLYSMDMDSLPSPSVASTIDVEKRKSSFQMGPESKRRETGFGEVGFKRRVPQREGVSKKARVKGLRSSALKRKAERQLMSKKFKKVKKRNLLKIETKNLGPRFMEKKAEKKSAPKKFDELPEGKTRSSKKYV